MSCTLMPAGHDAVVISAVFDQCNDHLRDADRKRDTLVASYAVIVGLLISAHRYITDTEIHGAVALGVTIIGVFVLCAVIHYRKWHVMYSRSIAVLLSIWTSDAGIKDAWAEAKGDRRSWSLLNPFGGTEAATIFVTVGLVAIPFHFAIRSLNFGPYAPNEVIAFATNASLVLLATLAYGGYVIYQFDRLAPEKHWPIAPFAQAPIYFGSEE
jgi:hypothetical protein